MEQITSNIGRKRGECVGDWLERCLVACCLSCGSVSRSAALLHSLVLVFALSSWLLVNSVWVELALIVETAPEGYGIASHMASEMKLPSMKHSPR